MNRCIFSVHLHEDSVGSIFDPDQPYSTHFGWQQEEDLHQETSLYVCLCTAGHRFPTHPAAARNYCGTPYHRATRGVCVLQCYNVDGNCLLFIQCYLCIHTS